MYDAGPSVVDAVRALRELARERPDELELFEGFTDAELDGWAVAVPEEVRGVLREIGGLETEDHEYRFGRAAARCSRTAAGPWARRTSARAR